MFCSTHDLRSEKLALRDGLSEDMHWMKSGAMVQNLMSIAAYKQAASVLFFVNFRSEIMTTSVIQTALDAGVCVCLPLTVTKPPTLIAYAVTNLTTDLQSGYQNIPEPNPEICQEVDPASLDVVIVPGSVFDKRGGRMGYGGGYYDRFLANLAPQAIRIGVCFDLQVEEEIPLEPHDQLLDFIVTEDCVCECFRGETR